MLLYSYIVNNKDMLDVDKFLTKENIVIAVMVFIMVAQSNYFATKLDLADVKLEMSQMREQLKAYSDDGDKEILNRLESKFNIISQKLDRIK